VEEPKAVVSVQSKEPTPFFEVEGIGGGLASCVRRRSGCCAASERESNPRLAVPLIVGTGPPNLG